MQRRTRPSWETGTPRGTTLRRGPRSRRNLRWKVLPFLWGLSLLSVLQCVPRVVSPDRIFRPLAQAQHLQGTLLLYQDGRCIVDSLVWLTYALPGETLRWTAIVQSPANAWLRDSRLRASLYSWDSLHASWNAGDHRIFWSLAAETTWVGDGPSGSLQVFPREEGPMAIAAPDTPGVYSWTVRTRQVWVLDRPDSPSETLAVVAERPVVLAVVFRDVPQDSVILGVPVGRYPTESERQASRYIRAHHWLYRQIPHLVPVWSPQEESLQISPHFTLGEFLCHAPTTYPRLLFVHPRLLRKLEWAIQWGNLGDLVIMSGYRYPRYNAQLGNGKFSMHVYGRAADVYVDQDGDGFMDDLNGDGRIGLKDAQKLAMLFQQVEHQTQWNGGIGIYDWNSDSTRTPFVHVDVRGFKARWGPWP